MIEVELIGVSVEVASNTPVVMLRELAGVERSLSIFIGAPEATAIAFALEGVKRPGPSPTTCSRTYSTRSASSIDQVVISELRDATFFAELHLTDGDTSWVVSSRPSDALALAARVECPIYVERSGDG